MGNKPEGRRFFLLCNLKTPDYPWRKCIWHVAGGNAMS